MRQTSHLGSSLLRRRLLQGLLRVSRLSEQPFGNTACAQATAALRACGGSLERAADWLFSRGDTLDVDVAAVLHPAAAPAGAAASATAAAAGVQRRRRSHVQVDLHVGACAAACSPVHARVQVHCRLESQHND